MAVITERIVGQSDGLLRIEFGGGGGYELTGDGYCLQAVGEVIGVAFYFRAKNGMLEFETEDDSGRSYPQGDPRRLMAKEVVESAGLTFSWRVFRGSATDVE